jgi:hypothetical protein
MLAPVAGWEYRWFGTFWAEAGRSKEYLTTVSYAHRWSPDGESEQPWPDEDGLNSLGREGWELVAVTRGSVTLITTISPQGNDGYNSFPTYTLAFKRPCA